MKVKRINYFEGSGFGINLKSTYPDEAWKVLEYLSGEKQQKEMGELQIYFPARQATLETIEWNEAMSAFLEEMPYGLDLQVVSQWETLTSNWFFWLATPLGGIDPFDLDKDVADIIAKCNTELAKHPVK